MKKDWIPESAHVTFVAMVVLFLYAIAYFYPDNWWGLHYPSYLGSMGFLMLALAIGLTIYNQKNDVFKGLANLKTAGNQWVWIGGLAAIAGIFFYQMPIYLDVYGDALKMIPAPDFIISEFGEVNKEAMKSLDFTNLKLGTDSTVGIAIWLSYSKQIELQEAFRIIGTFCGIGYVFFMLALMFRIAKNQLQRILFGLIVMGSPVLLVFCGHIEIYAPVLFLQAVFWYALVIFIEKPTWRLGLIVLFLCFLNLKFHISAVLTFMAFFTSLAFLFLHKRGKVLDWRNFGVGVLGLFTFGGILVYTFVTESIFGPRDFTAETLEKVIFIPIKSSDPAPFDRYNLFSWNHFFDYFNMMFLWSAIALIIIFTALFFKRKSIQWNAPLVLISGMGFIAYFMLFFVLNPLLSMPVDWDLMSIPAVPLMIFAAAIIGRSSESENKERSFASMLLMPAIGLFFIGISGIFVNANKESESDRIITCGLYSYKTYWKGGTTLIREGLKLKEDPDERFKILKKAIKEMKPYVVEEVDIQYAAMLHVMGNHYLNEKKDLNEAHKWYLKAEKADKRLLVNMLNITQTFYLRKEYDEAFLRAQNLIFNKFPEEYKSLRIGIQMALEVEKYEIAEEYCQRLLKINPNDTFIQEVLYKLQTSEDKSEIKNGFRRS